MVKFIAFPIFTGVAGELRPWISWLEAFFVREKFTADEKLTLAQSLLEGKAESWFYESRKTLIFHSWEDLKDHLLLRFGDFTDPDRIRFIAELDRFFADDISGEKKESKKKVDLSLGKIASQLTSTPEINTEVHVSASENLRNIDNRTETSVLDNLETVVKEARIQKNIRMDVGNGDVERIQRVMSITTNISAHHVFDELLLRRHKFQQRKKPSLSPKSRMFKFKNRTLLSNWSQMDLHQVIGISKVNNLSPCFRANFGLVRKKSKFQCLRLKTQAHKSRVLYQLRMLHDPGGMKQLLHGDMKSWFVCESESGKRFRDMAVQPKRQVGLNKIELQLDQRDITRVGLKVEIASLLEVICVGTECMMHRATVISAKLLENGLLVFPWNLMLLVFVLFIHLEDKVCLSGASNTWCGWLVFDRGKDHVISGDVITLVFLDNVEVGSKGLAYDGCVILGMNCAGFGRGKAELLATCKQMQRTDLFSFCCSCKNHLIVSEFEKKKQMLGDMTRMFKYKSRLQEINLTDTQFLWEKVHRVSCLSLAAQFNSLELIQAVLEKIIQGDQEASTKIIDKLQIKLQQGMDLHNASWHCFSDEMNQIHSPIGFVDALYSDLGENVHTLLAAEVHESGPGQRKFSSIWHRWRRKD